MTEALGEAESASVSGEVPVGAVVVCGEKIVGRGSNRPIRSCDPTAHAEILAIREAAGRLGNYRLEGCDLIVTLEPCLMCFGAAIHSRIGRVVFGASDPRVGAAALVEALQRMPGTINHRLEIESGLLADASAGMLRGFFAARR